MARMASEPGTHGAALRGTIQERRIPRGSAWSGHQRRELQCVDDQPVPFVHGAQPELRREELRQRAGPVAEEQRIPCALHHRYL